jgi:hypothetical protein
VITIKKMIKGESNERKKTVSAEEKGSVGRMESRSRQA